MSQVYSKVAEFVTYQYGSTQEEIGAILEQAGASRPVGWTCDTSLAWFKLLIQKIKQRSDRIFAAAKGAEMAESEGTSHHRPTFPTSTVEEEPSLPDRDAITPDKPNSLQRPVSRKGKEKAIYVEEEGSEASEAAEESDAEAAVQVQYDGAYASQLAIAEARQNGFTQELLETIARDGVSRVTTQAGLEDDNLPLPGGSGINPVCIHVEIKGS